MSDLVTLFDSFCEVEALDKTDLSRAFARVWSYGPRPILGADAVQRICERVEAGESLAAVGRSFGVSSHTVRRCVGGSYFPRESWEAARLAFVKAV